MKEKYQLFNGNNIDKKQVSFVKKFNLNLILKCW